MRTPFIQDYPNESHQKKVVVINYTGTVGKTTISANLLWPRMGGAPLYAIESINETAENLGLDVEKLRGDAFRELFKRLMLEDQAIIDVGASNVEDFIWPTWRSSMMPMRKSITS
nr:hypothetical protein pPsy0479a_00126 [Pseudomonas syringae]